MIWLMLALTVFQPKYVSIPATLLRERQGTTGRTNLAIEIHQVIFTECSLPSVSTMCLQKCVRDAATLLLKTVKGFNTNFCTNICTMKLT